MAPHLSSGYPSGRHNLQPEHLAQPEPHSRGGRIEWHPMIASAISSAQCTPSPGASHHAENGMIALAIAGRNEGGAAGLHKAAKAKQFISVGIAADVANLI
jgi:hypothetical protein